ncbi:hypothetical protein LUZ60_015248 [Juncus effusus]|nr:hypothetical protein LUZ60_015248 [Juncus effusus]
MAKLLIPVLCLTLFFYSTILARASFVSNGDKPFSFSFESFEKNRSSYPEIDLYGSSEISNSTVRISSSGLVVYRKPIRFVGRNPGFSAFFSFSLSAINGGSLGFFLTLSSVRMDLLKGAPPSVILVNFLLSIDEKLQNSSENHLEIDVGGDIAIKRLDLPNRDLVLSSGKKLHSWIDYNGTSNSLEIRLGKSIASKPQTPIISYPIDLSNILWREKIVVGFSSSIKNSTQNNNSIYSWSFSTNHGAPFLLHSEPLDPDEFDRANQNATPGVRQNYPWGVILALIFAALCGALVTFFILFIWFSVCANRPVEYPVHPSDLVFEKIVLVGVKNVQNEKK